MWLPHILSFFHSNCLQLLGMSTVSVFMSSLQGLFQLLEPAVSIRCRQQDLDTVKVVFLTLDFYDISTNLIITNLGLNLNSLLKFLIVCGLAQTLKKVVMSELLGCKHIEKGLFLVQVCVCFQQILNP